MADHKTHWRVKWKREKRGLQVCELHRAQHHNAPLKLLRVLGRVGKGGSTPRQFWVDVRTVFNELELDDETRAALSAYIARVIAEPPPLPTLERPRLPTGRRLPPPLGGLSNLINQARGLEALKHPADDLAAQLIREATPEELNDLARRLAEAESKRAGDDEK